MDVLYVEPTPGNGKGYLRRTYNALLDEGMKVRVVGFGYPPIYVEEGDKGRVAEIAKGIDPDAKIRDQHRTDYENVNSESDFDPEEHPDTIPIVEELDDANVFVSYNSKDKAIVRNIITTIDIEGVAFWMDDENMEAGAVQTILNEAIRESKVALLFIGTHGLGRWQDQEAQVFFTAHVEERKYLIPVLLPGATFPEDQALLGNLHRVEFKKVSDTNARNHLVRLISQALELEVPPRAQEPPPKGDSTKPDDDSGESKDDENGDTDDGKSEEGEEDKEVDKQKLHFVLGNRFTSFELRSLCNKLAVPYHDFKGNTKEDTADNIFRYYEANNRLAELDAKAREVNSNYFN